ncbi:MAG: hypothetical protein KME46_14880 [Brasilonema angustatum HA4187-MV1]|jgi:hypothetical protein|nr:hypothetical protein [Brasilonema angustatum HA4187-MV1]
MLHQELKQIVAFLKADAPSCDLSATNHLRSPVAQHLYLGKNPSDRGIVTRL